MGYLGLVNKFINIIIVFKQLNKKTLRTVFNKCRHEMERRKRAIIMLIIKIICVLAFLNFFTFYKIK